MIWCPIPQLQPQNICLHSLHSQYTVFSEGCRRTNHVTRKNTPEKGCSHMGESSSIIWSPRDINTSVITPAHVPCSRHTNDQQYLQREEDDIFTQKQPRKMMPPHLGIELGSLEPKGQQHFSYNTRHVPCSHHTINQ